jgi:large subunit ribosomal protein L15
MNGITLKAPKGSTKSRKILGRGQGSGRGGTSGKGHKGQNSRSGGGVRPGFEGGQMPLQRRIPKFGFTPPFRTPSQPVNLYSLQKLADKLQVTSLTLDPDTLYTHGLVSKRNDPVKVLGHGEITVKIDITAHSVSNSAKEKIEALGGSIKTIE